MALDALAGALTARADVLVFQVAPLLSRSPGGACPTSLSLEQTRQPYREGSYAIDGRADLAGIASGWRLASRDPFSATWEASLLPAFRGCRAAAGIVRVNNEPSADHPYLRMRFSEGRLQLILDMTGLRDPNGYTTTLLRAAVRQGQPVWTWGGSD